MASGEPSVAAPEPPAPVPAPPAVTVDELVDPLFPGLPAADVKADPPPPPPASLLPLLALALALPPLPPAYEAVTLPVIVEATPPAPPFLLFTTVFPPLATIELTLELLPSVVA